MAHFVDNIKNFDNYGCFVFERAIHRYVGRSFNKRNLESMFVKAESKREELNFWIFLNQIFSSTDIFVPVYPVDGEIWHAHVQSSDKRDILCIFVLITCLIHSKKNTE